MSKVKLKKVVMFELTEEQSEILRDTIDILHDMNEKICGSTYEDEITVPINLDVISAINTLEILMNERCILKEIGDI